ncbi:MAG: hypothetical protein JJ899_04865 [Alphaproteobacteria bacterium]|nr:hypothetical protein [Alphaproteobacteria bacterium]
MTGRMDMTPPKRSWNRTTPRINKALRSRFLETLLETGNVSAAVRASGVHSDRWYRLRRTDPAFAEEWAFALDQAMDMLEAEAVRRGVTGWQEPVFYGGKQVGSVTRYSDRLLLSLLKAHRPERYGDRVGVAVTSDLRSLLDEIGEEDDAGPVIEHDPGDN